jgi:hypothetical protein
MGIVVLHAPPVSAEGIPVTEQNPAEQHPQELTIIQSAQAFVDTWLHDKKRRPFAPLVEAAASRWGDDHPTAERQRLAFIRVAKAIRAGAGHASAKPAPLLKIVRTALRRDEG